jgi:hypothetical protein
MKAKKLPVVVNGLQTLSDSCGSDEGAVHDHAGSLLSHDASDRGALQWLVELRQKLRISYTEARSVCVSMMTDVVVSIEDERVVAEVVGNLQFQVALNRSHVIASFSTSVS